jgi:hypothetical protein
LFFALLPESRETGAIPRCEARWPAFSYPDRSPAKAMDSAVSSGPVPGRDWMIALRSSWSRTSAISRSILLIGSSRSRILRARSEAGAAARFSPGSEVVWDLAALALLVFVTSQFSTARPR